MATANDVIKVLLVDDHFLFLDGISKNLELEDDLEVVGTASNGDDALSLISDLEPHVVILDVQLEGDLNGMDVASQLRSAENAPHIILITAYDDHPQSLHAIRSGARGYCNKGIHPDELISAIRVVMDDKYVMRSEVHTEHSILDWAKETMASLGVPDISEAEGYFRPLTPREKEVLRLVTLGRSNQEAARELHISQQTVKNHMSSIFEKLYVKDRTQAAVYAISHGWVRIDDALRG